MSGYIAANTGGMRDRVPALDQAANTADRIGSRLASRIEASEPIADWTTDETTENYMKLHNYMQDFSKDLFSLLDKALNGRTDAALGLTQLLEAVEEYNLAEAKNTGNNLR